MAEEFETSFRAPRNRTGLKALAIALAGVCWYTIREETSYEQMIRGVTIEIKTPAGWNVTAQTETSADVLFRGSRSDLRGLTREDVQIEVDAPRATATTNAVIRLSPRDVRVSAGVRALRVVPSSIGIRLEAP